jgi:hypothetical protein
VDHRGQQLDERVGVPALEAERAAHEPRLGALAPAAHHGAAGVGAGGDHLGERAGP